MRSHPSFPSSAFMITCASLGLAACAAAPPDAGVAGSSEDEVSVASTSQALDTPSADEAPLPRGAVTEHAFDAAVDAMELSCSAARDSLREFVNTSDSFLLLPGEPPPRPIVQWAHGPFELKLENHAALTRAMALHTELGRFHSAARAIDAHVRCLTAVMVVGDLQRPRREAGGASGSRQLDPESGSLYRRTPEQDERLAALGPVLDEAEALCARIRANVEFITGRPARTEHSPHR